MRGERERLPEQPMKIISRPLSNYLAAAARAVVAVNNFDRNQSTILHLYPWSICFKDQLGYLIIERWSNKLTNYKHTALNCF